MAKICVCADGLSGVGADFVGAVEGRAVGEGDGGCEGEGWGLGAVVDVFAEVIMDARGLGEDISGFSWSDLQIILGRRDSQYLTWDHFVACFLAITAAATLAAMIVFAPSTVCRYDCNDPGLGGFGSCLLILIN